jgi:alpha-L-rhamnosidase
VDTSVVDAGFHTVLLHPVFDARLGSVDFSYPSSYGVIKSSWTVQGSTAQWNVTIPANTTGRLDLAPAEILKYRIQGVPIMESKLVQNVNSGIVIPAGSYTFTVALK